MNEVIIVDSGEERLQKEELIAFDKLNITYITSEKSVCRQRNLGIALARSSWIFLCDDDISIGRDYVKTLQQFISNHPEAGAVSGTWLEMQDGQWQAFHPIRSSFMLAWSYLFRLSIWGPIECSSRTWLFHRIKAYYHDRGNHIARSGWPVITDFGGESFVCPVFSLGASLIKKEWLLASPFDEALDRHGIGDNYGVAMQFPYGIHVVNTVQVYHHEEARNRLSASLQYYRRVLALHYFISGRKSPVRADKMRLLWSIVGQWLLFLKAGDRIMSRAARKAFVIIAFNKNPYATARRRGIKFMEPMLGETSG